MATETRLVRIGWVVKPHGILGELVVEPAGDSLAGLSPGHEIWIADGSPSELAGIRPHAGRFLVRVTGIDDRDAADALRGRWLRLPEAELPAPAPGEAYAADLVGCQLADASGAPIGRVVRVHGGGPRDLLEVEVEDGTRLVPMVADWLIELDVAGGTIRMDLPDGLLEER